MIPPETPPRKPRMGHKPVESQDFLTRRVNGGGQLPSWSRADCVQHRRDIGAERAGDLEPEPLRLAPPERRFPPSSAACGSPCRRGTPRGRDRAERPRSAAAPRRARRPRSPPAGARHRPGSGKRRPAPPPASRRDRPRSSSAISSHSSGPSQSAARGPSLAEASGRVGGATPNAASTGRDDVRRRRAA